MAASQVKRDFPEVLTVAELRVPRPADGRELAAWYQRF